MNTGCDVGQFLPTAIKVEDRLQETRKRLIEQLNDVESAISALEKNPEMLNILNLLRRVGI